MTPSHTRRYDLDWLRIFTFGLLIFYHIGMFYVSWDFHVKSVHAGPFIEPVMKLVNPWRMSVLFIISGVALRYAMDAAALQRFVWARFWLTRQAISVPIEFLLITIITIAGCGLVHEFIIRRSCVLRPLFGLKNKR